MIAAGLVDPRYKEPVASRRALASAAKTTTSTISAMIAGTRDTEGPIIQRVAEALKMGHRADEVTAWVGHARTQSKPFVAHRDADLLTSEEQEAVNELIRLLASSKKRAAPDATPASNVTSMAESKRARRQKVIDQGQPQRKAGYESDDE